MKTLEVNFVKQIHELIDTLWNVNNKSWFGLSSNSSN